MANGNNGCNCGCSCGCPCHRAHGVLITLFGLVFLLAHLDVISTQILNISWPVLVMVFGIKHSIKGICKCCSCG